MRRLLPLLGCTAVLLAGVLSAPVAAAPAEQARVQPSAGSFQETPPVLLSSRLVGNVFFFDLQNTSMLTGTFTSTTPAVAEYNCMQVIGDDSFRCKGEQTFTGTVAGVAGIGTSTARIVFVCSFTEGTCEGTSVAGEGTGPLAGVRAVHHFQDSLATASGTYEGHVIVP